MGQYYVIVNLDKQQLIAPSAFGDGSKLLEFGCSGEGVMTALAALTACGNGRGSGELSRVAYESASATAFEPTKVERVDSEQLGTCDHNYNQLPDGQLIKRRIIVPTFTGTWAGDRIITAGDYMDDHLYMTDEEYLVGLEEDFRERHESYNKTHVMAKISAFAFLATKPPISYNLYHHACRTYENISEDVKRGLAVYELGCVSNSSFSDIMRDFLHRRIDEEYQTGTMVGQGPKRRYKWRTEWLTAEMLDSFLRRWPTVEDFKTAKAWLKKQQLLHWQRDFIKCYRVSDGEVVFNDDRATIVLGKHGIFWLSTSLSQIETAPILPRRELLDAALKVQYAETSHVDVDTSMPRHFLERIMQARARDPHFNSSTATNIDADMQRVAERAGLACRHRVIELDNKGEL